MIEYLRRYLADPEEPLVYNPQASPANTTQENELTIYIRRYLADPIN